MTIDQFREKERRMIQHAIENARREIPDEDIMFSELPSALQHDFTWEELKALLSALGGIKHDVIDTNMYIFPPEEYDNIWYETMMKVYALAIQHFSKLRIQPCKQDGCSGNLIFIDFTDEVKGKVPVMKLLPDTAHDHLGPSAFSEDMYGYIIAMCPSCGFIQLYDAPGGN